LVNYRNRTTDRAISLSEIHVLFRAAGDACAACRRYMQRRATQLFELAVQL